MSHHATLEGISAPTPKNFAKFPIRNEEYQIATKKMSQTTFLLQEPVITKTTRTKKHHRAEEDIMGDILDKAISLYDGFITKYRIKCITGSADMCKRWTNILKKFGFIRDVTDEDKLTMVKRKIQNERQTLTLKQQSKKHRKLKPIVSKINKYLKFYASGIVYLITEKGIMFLQIYKGMRDLII